MPSCSEVVGVRKNTGVFSERVREAIRHERAFVCCPGSFIAHLNAYLVLPVGVRYCSKLK
jgi:hypothetical protein